MTEATGCSPPHSVHAWHTHSPPLPASPVVSNSIVATLVTEGGEMHNQQPSLVHLCTPLLLITFLHKSLMSMRKRAVCVRKYVAMDFMAWHGGSVCLPITILRT